MRFLLLAALLGVMVVAAGCAPPPVLRDPDVLRDTSLLTGEPCEAPCFHGITPGVTTWSDAVTLVEDNRLFSGIEQPPLGETAGMARALEFDAAETNRRCCGIFSDDGVVVSSIFTLVAPVMTLGQVIDQFGDPSYLTAEGISDDQASVALVYPEVPMIVYAFAAGLEHGSLSETSEIFAHVYLSAENMQQAMAASSLFAWDGYGPLSLLTGGELAITPLPEDERGAAATEEAPAAGG